MASVSRRLAENAAGDFFVDSSCIDCGTCRQIAPRTFAEGREASFVHLQPQAEAETHRARMALVACPVAAIGTHTRHALAAARNAFPEHLDASVYYCGYAAESSYGARSYLIVRPQGNILVDSPRYAAALVRRIQVLGGVRWMFLTHRDDVADHRKFRDRFGCERILHRDDQDHSVPVERVLEGEDSCAFDDEVLFLPVPGHTRGSTCLLYRGKFLFSGDHAWWDPHRGRVVASRQVCWYDWEKQIVSMQRLAAHRFEWLLPGHGMRGHASPERMAGALLDCVRRMRRQ